MPNNRVHTSSERKGYSETYEEKKYFPSGLRKSESMQNNPKNKL